MKKTVKEIVAEIKNTMDARGGLKHVYFVACGGSKAAIFPGLYLLQSEAKTFGATTYTSNEFVHATPAELDERCVAVICSLKATAETVEAVKTANAKGAVTIAMTGNMQTGMAQVGQHQAQSRPAYRQPVQPAAPKTADQLFEEKLKAFMTESDSKISSIKQYSDHRTKSRRR